MKSNSTPNKIIDLIMNHMHYIIVLNYYHTEAKYKIYLKKFYLSTNTVYTHKYSSYISKNTK